MAKIYPKWYKICSFDINYTRYSIKMTKLATFVKTKRKQFGLTQEDLSRKSGVGLRFIRELEQGKETLRMDKVNQLLSLFGAELTPMEADRS